MNAWLSPSEAAAAVPLIAVDADHLARLADGMGEPVRHWCAANAFAGVAGEVLPLPAGDGGVEAILAGCNPADPLRALAHLPLRLPAGGAYRLDSRGLALDAEQVALGWALGAYRFGRYRDGRAPARLLLEPAVAGRARAMAEAVYHVRDLVNTPTEDLGPAELADEVRALAGRHGAEYREWVGDELLGEGFRLVHAVGRASHRAPRLAMLQAGPEDAPGLVLVGKGVCFDTGGLDVKGGEGMRWMKKDMGGAAHAIALAGLVLDAKLPVRLTLLVPAVENAIAGNAFRPGEVIVARSGLSVEIDNTDAEGRLILADALDYARSLDPDLVLDFATLTGAARVALGPELPALFSNRDDIAAGLLDAAAATRDPLWRMPLWRPYLTMLESDIATLANSGGSRKAGAITAALFLERFVGDQVPWAHLDVYAWNDSPRPGHPRGGEAQGLRAYFEFLLRRYGSA
ncbi:MAG: leucyl aminopeptidase family protein [Xanthomonadales bacterium]|nr:leucyl aminopeptidase family protein [Xanthomonadales bacterium]